MFVERSQTRDSVRVVDTQAVLQGSCISDHVPCTTCYEWNNPSVLHCFALSMTQQYSLMSKCFVILR